MRIPEVVLGTDWELGSRNDDDDFHTDVQFLRVSVRRLQSSAGMAHDRALLHYTGFCGTFYYSRQSTARLCEALIHRLKNDRAWGDSLIAQISERSNDLWTVFDDTPSRPDDWNALLALYQRQLECHARLYEVCWIPEILQADHVGLTNYLHLYLRTKLPSAADAHHAFILLTFDPDPRGALGLNEILVKLADKIHRTHVLSAQFRQPLRYLRLIVPAWLRRSLEEAAAEYGYLTYHGYGDRHVQGADELLGRLRELVQDDRALETLRAMSGNRNKLKRERAQLIRSLRFDPVHLRLFRFEARAATLKLRRRLAQLKNFYHLDRLLGCFAQRLDVSEATVRFMLPEEIIHHVATGAHVRRSVRLRQRGMLYFLDSRSERVFTSPDALAFAARLQEPTETVEITALKGQPASTGTVAGRAVVAFRAADAERFAFRRGDILVTAEGDTDLMDVLRLAGGLVTDQGGVTCHLGTIARDLGIPAVLGTGRATTWIETGDTVYIDACEGTVQKLPPLGRQKRSLD